MLKKTVRKRKLLLLLVIFWAALGVVLLQTPFWKALTPSAQAEANLPRFDISGLRNGSYKIFLNESFPKTHNDFSWHVMVVKKPDGNIVAFDIPMKEGKVGFPDFHWWRPAWLCEDFYPKQTAGQGFTFKCRDNKNEENAWLSEYEWDSEGKNIQGGVSDMLKANGVIEDNKFVLHKKG